MVPLYISIVEARVHELPKSINQLFPFLIILRVASCICFCSHYQLNKWMNNLIIINYFILFLVKIIFPDTIKIWLVSEASAAGVSQVCDLMWKWDLQMEDEMWKSKQGTSNFNSLGFLFQFLFLNMPMIVIFDYSSKINCTWCSQIIFQMGKFYHIWLTLAAGYCLANSKVRSPHKPPRSALQWEYNTEPNEFSAFQWPISEYKELHFTRSAILH